MNKYDCFYKEGNSILMIPKNSHRTTKISSDMIKISNYNSFFEKFKLVDSKHFLHASEEDFLSFIKTSLPIMNNPSFKWNIILHGHGQSSSKISGLNIESFKTIINSFSKTISVKNLFISSCYAGGVNKLQINDILNECNAPFNTLLSCIGETLSFPINFNDYLLSINSIDTDLEKESSIPEELLKIFIENRYGSLHKGEYPICLRTKDNDSFKIIPNEKTILIPENGQETEIKNINTIYINSTKFSTLHIYPCECNINGFIYEPIKEQISINNANTIPPHIYPSWILISNDNTINIDKIILYNIDDTKPIGMHNFLLSFLTTTVDNYDIFINEIHCKNDFYSHDYLKDDTLVLTDVHISSTNSELNCEFHSSIDKKNKAYTITLKKSKTT